MIQATPTEDRASRIDGTDTVVSLEHFYRFERPVSDGGYVVIPHGSGYLIPADCPDELPGEGHTGGLIGGRWTLPMFGIVRNDSAMCAVVETWWDCDVAVEHQPGAHSALDFRWNPSLGRLDYPRRFLLRFADGMDYVGMAKCYRAYAKEHGLLRTLEEKAAETPTIWHDIEAVLFSLARVESRRWRDSAAGNPRVAQDGVSREILFSQGGHRRAILLRKAHRQRRTLVGNRLCSKIL